MSPEARPAADEVDPGSPRIPPSLEPALTDSDTPILLLVASDTGHQTLAAAVALADHRARAGRGTVLADAGVTNPRLHTLLGVENVEGLADLFLFGASLEHVRVPMEDRSFDFVPTGAYIPDPAAVLDSGRWDRIGEELTAEGSLLLLFVPAATPGVGALSRRVGRAIIIGDEAGVERATARLDRSCHILGTVRTDGGVADGAEPAPGAAAGIAGPDGEAAPDTLLTEPVVSRPGRRRKRLVSPLLVIGLIVALAAGGWLLYSEFAAGSAPSRTAAAAPAAPAPAPEPVERGEPVETPIPVSVAVEAHQDLESAQQRAATLRRAEPGVNFYLAPVSVNGSLFYRLLSGPVEDAEAGNALMQRLVDARHKTAFDSWAIRPTELAFHLGEYDTRAGADARVDSLAAADIPAYIVPIRYEPGAPRYRVYGGAYENTSEAAVMQQMLEEAGIEVRLVPRTGEPVAGS